MKSFISTRLFILLLFTLTSCEVFKTTPRSSPEYRGAGSKNKNSVHKKKPAGRNASGRPTLVGSSNRNRSQPSSRTGNRGNTPARNTPEPRKSLAVKPAGEYAASVPEVVQIARTFTGTPYRSGGNDKAGIDCSGLICQVYTEMGIKVPRISWQQSEFGSEVEQIKDLRPGDWIFFVPEGGKEGYVSHSGIITEIRGEGDILFIHASSSRGVTEDNLFSNYFRNRFVKAIRPF